MGAWEWRWLIWALLFVLFETWAIVTRETTLSEEVWQVFAVRGEHTVSERIRRTLLLLLMAWLTVHFLTGGRFV